MTNLQTVAIAVKTLQRLDDNLRLLEGTLLSTAAEGADQKSFDAILKQTAAANEASEDLKHQLEQLQYRTRAIPVYSNLIVR